MSRPPVALGQFASLEGARDAQQRLASSGVPSEIASTCARLDAEPDGFALLIDPEHAARASRLLLPDELPSHRFVREGETALRVALAIVAVLFGVGLVLGLVPR